MNKTITMYELLGLVKDGKAPKRIKSEGHNYNYNEIEKDYYEGMGYDYEYLFKNTPNDRLNDTVEILKEEKKIPEKLKWNEKSQHNVVTDNTKKTLEHLLSRSEQLKKSINEIIDCLDYLKSKGDE